jgi:cytochrome c oxidase subunit 2
MRCITNLQKFFISLVLLLITPLASADWQMNMPVGATPVSHDVFALHMAAFWICVGIAIIVFGVMLYALIYHRKSAGHQAAHFHEHLTLEIVWAIIPFLILIAMAIPATKILMNMNDESKSEVTIKITGYQWKWKYEYLDQGISYFSNLSTPQDQLNNQAAKGQWYLLEVDKPLVIPIHKKIRFLMTANDVIHSWWVPALGIKRDALPGFINEAWALVETPGTYRGQCAELCGTNHGFMPIVVQAVSEDDFNKWVAQQTGQKAQAAAQATQKMTKDQLMALGEKAYNTTCAVCHKPDGVGMPPVFPALKGSKIATGPIKDHINIVLNGKPGTAMQAFGSQLSDTDIAAIVTYERNAWGNNTGDVVQPSDITAARK